jgi:hypothetical protein
MASTDQLPLGIRNNNPGNLRKAYGMNYPTRLNEGFAVFNSMTDGLEALACLVSDYYSEHGLRTLPAFIARYAPASENDVALYIKNMALQLHLNPLKLEAIDLRLDRSWCAMDFIRAVIVIENGRPREAVASWPEWCSIPDLSAAMSRACKWGGV